MRTGILVVIATCSSALFAQEKVRLDRNPKPGTVFEVNSQIEQTMRGVAISAFGVDRAAVFLIRVTVTKVDDKGRATSADLHIVRYAGTNRVGGAGGKLSAHMMGKTVQVDITDGRRRYYERNDGTTSIVDDAWTGILDLAVPLRFLNEPGFDDILGTEEPQKRGATWKVDPEKAAAAYAAFKATKEKVKGSTTLKPGAGVQRVEGKLQLSGLVYTLPAGYTQTDDQYEMVFNSILPADENALPSEQSLRITRTVNAMVKGRKAGETTVQAVRAQYKLVKP